MVTLNDLTPDHLRALARLKQIGGERTLEVIDIFMEDGKDSLVTASDMVSIHRLQGRVEAFRMFKEAVEEAAKLDARSNRV